MFKEEVKSFGMDSGGGWWAQGQFPKRRWGQGEGGLGVVPRDEMGRGEDEPKDDLTPGRG